MIRRLQTGIVAGLLLASTGCGMFTPPREAFSQSLRMFRPNPLDGPLEPKDTPDEWGFVGKEARGDQDRERDPDRWWQNWIMSEEARNIERNLGID
ncbi:MAG: hypothetical protein KDA81_06940 [Planctomycetaceae bacterium]|nr:hypothetical protein [Planctomycetaceae bacterium]